MILLLDMQSKRGQALSTNSIILIILGVIILVVLIVGFNAGWQSFAPWLKSNNVDTIMQSCEAACAVQGTYDFCSVERELKDDDGVNIDASCYVLSLDENLKKYGIKSCDTLHCSISVPCDKFGYTKDDSNQNLVIGNPPLDSTKLSSYCTGVVPPAADSVKE